MGSFSNIQKLLEVINFLLQENIVVNDDDAFIADFIVKSFKKQIDTVERYTIEYIHNKTFGYPEVWAGSTHTLKRIENEKNNCITEIEEYIELENEENKELEDIVPNLNVENKTCYIIQEENDQQNPMMDAFKQSDEMESYTETEEQEAYTEIEEKEAYIENQEKEAYTENEEEEAYNETEDKEVYQEDDMKCTSTQEESKHKSVFRCIFCQVDFEASEEAQKHDKENHMVNGHYYKCMICAANYEEKKEVVEHYIREHQTKPSYKCTHCEEFYQKGSQLRDHLEKYHGVVTKQNACPICFKEFRNERPERALEGHMERIHSGMQFDCNICDRKLNSMTALKFHRKIYHEDDRMEKVPCHICGLNIAKMYLDDHVVNRHNQQEKSISCLECDKKFYSQIQLTHHMKQVHAEKKFMCNQCDYKSSQKHNLKVHQAIHSDERLSCNVCHEKLKYTSLSSHMRNKHINKRKHNCDFCGKAFKTATHMKQHRKIHTGEYGGHCDICGKDFVQKHNYMLHMKKNHQITLNQ